MSSDQFSAKQLSPSEKKHCSRCAAVMAPGSKLRWICPHCNANAAAPSWDEERLGRISAIIQRRNLIGFGQIWIYVVALAMIGWAAWTLDRTGAVVVSLILAGAVLNPTPASKT